MAVKKTERGKVLVTHEGFSVRQVPTYEGLGASRKMKTSTIALFMGKRKIHDGFSNPNKAIEFIDKNLEYYDKNDRKFYPPKTDEG